jgi:putative spermidine/putrescine transport system permease protein
MRKIDPAFVVLLFVLFILPLGVLGLYAVSAGWTFPQVVPETLSPRALNYVIGQVRPVAISLGSSLLYSLLTALLTFILCLWPAQVFARQTFKYKTLLEGLLLAPALAPAMTFSMGVHFLFIKMNLADHMTGVVLVLTVFTYPYMLRTLVSGYMSFGPEYNLCAKNLGAGPLTRLFRVELPLLLPAAIAGGSVVFLIAFSEYFLVFLVGGGSVPSFAGYLFPFLTSSDRSVASVLTLVFLVVPIVLFILIEATVSRAYRRMGLA